MLRHCGEPYIPRLRGKGEGMLLPESGERAGAMGEGLQDAVPLEGSHHGTGARSGGSGDNSSDLTLFSPSCLLVVPLEGQGLWVMRSAEINFLGYRAGQRKGMVWWREAG